MTTPLFDTDMLIDGADFYGLSLNSEQVSLFERYFSLLVDWNNRVNLISRNDISRFITHHIFDSFKVASVYDFTVVERFCDFGSGSGIPGIPLAIAFPSFRIDLIESRRKRCDFLDFVINELYLSRCSLVCGRAERYIAEASPVYDAVITRATCSLVDFFTLFRNSVTTGGSLISIKGDLGTSERIDLLNAVPSDIFSIDFSRPKEYPHVRTGTIVIINRT